MNSPKSDVPSSSLLAGGETPADNQQWEQPPDWIRFVRRHIWKIAVVLGIVMLTGIRPFLIHRPSAPEVLSILPDSQLVDQNGQIFSRDQMRGKVWIVGFIFTRCPTVCPRVTQVMVDLQETVRRAQLDDRVALLSVTVDPEFDTPMVLRNYAEKVGANLSNWHFVGGTQPAIHDFVGNGFMLNVGEKTPAKAGDAEFNISHSTKLALVDASGQVRAYFSTEDGPEEQERLFQALFPVIRLATKES